MHSRMRNVVAASVAGLALTSTVGARQQPAGTIEARFAESQAATRHHPVMVSVVREGTLVVQNEQLVPSSLRFLEIPPGSYDVRAESDGAVTEVKRGVQVFPGQTLILQFVLRAGQGVHTVEYAAGGLAREEVAARLARLETAVAELQRAAQGRHN